MKLLQLAALFSGMAAAVRPLAAAHYDVRALTETTTSVTFVTSTELYTYICLRAPDCPAGSTVIQTSTTVAKVTTTVCAETMHSRPPGYPGITVSESGTLISPSVTSGTEALPGISVSASGSGVVPIQTPNYSPVDTGSVPAPTGPEGTPYSSGGGSVPPNTNTDSAPTSLLVSSNGYAVPSGTPGAPSNLPSSTSATEINPTQISSLLHTTTVDNSGPHSDTSSATFGGPVTSAPISGSPATPSSTDTDAASVSAGTSSEEYPLPSVSLPPGPYTSIITGTEPVVTSITSESVGPISTASPSSDVQGSTRITSTATQHITSYVTAQPSSSRPDNTASDIDAAPASLISTVSAWYPSGSGSPYPSTNGTLVSPRPSYSEVPINMGQVVEPSQNAFVAIIVAMIFALFA